jgi:GNAT superfamily N-acetyltransferase
MTEARIRAIERALFSWASLFVAAGIETHREADVTWWVSDVDFALFNGAMDAHFAPGEETRRTREVLEQLIGNGRPFLWWLTPSTRSAGIERLLASHGLVRDPATTTGMYVDLADVATLDEPLPPGTTVELTTADTLTEAAETMIAAFGFPAHTLSSLRRLLAARPDDLETAHLLARVDGQPVGTGTLGVVQGVAGLFDIGVRAEGRGHGVGRAITLALLRLARERGCDSSVLHATPLGLPVYARIGYQAVCDIDLSVWAPGP